MRSLVLGGSTFVGRRLVQQLAGQGHEVSVLNRGRTPSALPPDVGRFIADRTDVGSMRSALEGTEWDAIFDVSGFVMVAGGSPIADLLELFDGRTAAYVFVSSVMAYQPSPLMPWTEDQPTSTEPTTKYAGFKAYAAGEEGLEGEYGVYAHIGERTWQRLLEYKRVALVEERPRKSLGSPVRRMHITANGRALYHDQWSRYREMYPDVEAAEPKRAIADL